MSLQDIFSPDSGNSDRPAGAEGAGGACPEQRFPALEPFAGWLRHTFLLRHPAIDVGIDRETALARLRSIHLGAVRRMGFSEEQLFLAQQVHGDAVSPCDPVPAGVPWPSVDGLTTRHPGSVLGIHVADCAAVYVIDPEHRAVALLHSGRKGSEQGIIRNALALMAREYGSRPENLVVQLSPCIRPPDYEVDFAAWIRRDAAACGVPPGQIHDEGASTAEDLGRYYSYRAEKGRTGRMFAVLGLVEGL